MKNFLFIIIVFLSLISCGKKGDPEYKDNTMIQNQKTTLSCPVYLPWYFVLLKKKKRLD